jgi:hypothetical protein
MVHSSTRGTGSTASAAVKGLLISAQPPTKGNFLIIPNKAKASKNIQMGVAIMANGPTIQGKKF